MDTDPQAITDAHTALDSLLGHMDISRVVCVDDQYAKKYQIEHIAALCSILDTAQLSTISSIKGIADEKDEDTEVFNDSLTELWESLEIDQKKKSFDELLAISEQPAIEFDEATGHLATILEKHSFDELSLAEWTSQKEAILESADQAKILILFDQNLTEEEGRADEGIIQIQKIVDEEKDSNIYLGLLSNTAEADGEIAAWEQLATQYSIPSENFLFIAKERLRNPLSFVRMLKLAAISKDCDSLKECAKKLYTDAVEEALKEIQKINIYDFEHIVFTHSNAEGIWEPEMLFRMFNHYHQKNLTQKATPHKELHKLTHKIRPISSIPIPEESSESPPHQTREYQRNELYQDIDFINSLHQPIELGDIFKKITGNKLFILLGQPCELMLRPNNGKRSTETAVLAELKIVENNTGSISRDKSSYEELEYYCPDENKKAYVLFNRKHTVQLCILDLCVFQTDGSAKIQLENDCPEGLLIAGEKQFNNIKKTFSGILKKVKTITDIPVASLPKQEKIQICKALHPKATDTGMFPCTLKEQQFEFPIKRVGRISKDKASAILTKFSHFISRAAFDRDVGGSV